MLPVRALAYVCLCLCTLRHRFGVVECSPSKLQVQGSNPGWGNRRPADKALHVEAAILHLAHILIIGDFLTPTSAFLLLHSMQSTKLMEITFT